VDLKARIATHAMSALINAIPPELLRDQVDALLDIIERGIEESDTKVDDAVVGPIIDLVRVSFDIPDGDD